ncbi:MAG: glycosyltransferase family 4 protein, partial [Cyclobacteriaceae bacterium]
PNESKLHNMLNRDGVKVLSLPLIELQKNYLLFLYLPFLLFNSFRIARFIKQNGIDVLHINDMYNMCGIALKLFRPGTKVVYHIRLMPDSYVKSLYGFFIYLIRRFADQVISVSEAVKIQLDKFELFSVLVYDAIKVTEKYDVKNLTRGNKLLYLANFSKGKGHDHAIKAFAAAKTRVPDLQMVIAGGDMGMRKNELYKKDLEREVKRLEFTDSIEFRGYVDDTEQIIKDSDIFLNFSESESFSITCLEAVTYGIPLIATDCGGPSEIFENEVSGLLVPNKGIEEMAEAIVRLSQNKSLRESFSQKGKKYVTTKFGLLKSAEALSSVYIGLWK